MSVTLDQLKTHLRVTGSNQDAAIQTYLDGSIEFIESETGRKLSQAARVSYFDNFSSLELIGDNPTNVIVKYLDDDGVLQTLASSIYSLKAHKVRAYITLEYNQSWPSFRAEDAAVKVEYDSGYIASTIPKSLVSAVLLMGAHLFNNREAVSPIKLHEVPLAVQRLINSHKIYKT